MRELNQKIFDIADMDSADDDLDYDESVSIGQIITDNILEEEVDEQDASLSREEADKVITDEKESIYGKKQSARNTTTSIDLKEVFQKPTGPAPAAKQKMPPAPSKKGSKKVRKVRKKVKKKVSKKKGGKKQQVDLKVVLGAILLLVLTILYFISE